MRHHSRAVVLDDTGRTLDFPVRGARKKPLRQDGRHESVRFGEADDAVVFGPEDIAVMRNAFEKSWAALAFAAWRDDVDMRITRERIARSILHNVASGERRVGQLTDHALGSLEPRSA